MTVGKTLSEVRTVRPEPFGSELKAELLTAEGAHPAEGGTIPRAQRVSPVWVDNLMATP
ncbi:MAG: hypothetical protein P8075_06680 [Deltaproteobacteria bacterium]